MWAPRAGTVELVLDGASAKMHAMGGGWWESAQAAVPGRDYSFRLDGGDPRPDPRSAHQPYGVHGPSRVVDHGSFEWTDHRWPGLDWSSAVVYELHIGTFSSEGTFGGAIGHLDHLKDLGVTAVEIMPVAEFSGTRGWGYDGVDLFAPHHSYGGPDGLKSLVDACHDRGLGVLLDVVYNHLGPEGNYLPQFGPYLTDRHATFWGDAVNFDGPGSEEVRRFVVDNACMWLADYHIDGLRLDAVHAIVDDSSEHILRELGRGAEGVAERTGRPRLLVAESDLNDPVFVTAPRSGGYGLDAVWADEWHHALHAVLTGEQAGYYQDFGSWSTLAKALRQGWVHDGTWSQFRGRIHGKPLGTLGGDRLVVATQNHDQVGNRAVGERSAALVDVGKLKVAAALLLTSPFVPLIFAGEEWGASTPFQYFTDHQDPQLARAVSKGRRREFRAFGWNPEQVPDPQDPASFRRSRLRWDERSSGIHAELMAWYRDLIALRRRLPAGEESPVVEFDDRQRWLAVLRPGAATVVNLGDAPVEVPIDLAGSLQLASRPGIELIGGAVFLPPDSAAVVAT